MKHAPNALPSNLIEAISMESRALEEPGKKLSKSDQVYLHVKDRIMHNELRPGQKIIEEDLAASLQISRTPVREALHRLSSDGLITLYPKRYAEVTFFTPEMVNHLGVVRMSQDILSGHLAIYYGSDAEFAQLKQMAELCEAAARSGNLYDRITSDCDFHLKITEIGKNSILLNSQRQIYPRIHLLQLQYTTLVDGKRADFHDRLIASLSSRDIGAYVSEICQRYQQLYDLDDKIIDLYRK